MQAIENTFHRRSQMIAENIAHMLGQTSFTLQRIYFPIKKKMEESGPKLHNVSAPLAVCLCCCR